MQPCHGMYIYHVMGMQPGHDQCQAVCYVKQGMQPGHDQCRALCQAGYDAALS
jgi:hypothetical protein